MKNKLIKIIKLLLIIIFNDIFIGMILGFLWYKLGFAKTTINMMSGIDTLKIIFLKFKYIYYFILFIIELRIIIFFKRLFNNKKTYIIYHILSFVVSMLLLLYSNIGFNTGYGIIEMTREIKEIYIFVACIGLRYSSWILILNIPSLLGIVWIRYNRKKRIIKEDN